MDAHPGGRYRYATKKSSLMVKQVSEFQVMRRFRGFRDQGFLPFATSSRKAR
jgi:hypothetical protein